VLHEVDAQTNAKRAKKPHAPSAGLDAVPFDPPGALLDLALGRADKAGAP
jgi:hypothetical protein